MADDPWLGQSSTTSDNSYSVDKFYTASRNAKGFGTTIRITVSPQLLAEIGSMVASRQVAEYRVNADFFRDAIVHRLHYLQDKIAAGDEFIPSEMSRSLRALEKAERAAITRDAQEAYIRLVEDNLRKARNEQERQRIIQGIIETQKEMTDSNYLRNELQRLLG